MMEEQKQSSEINLTSPAVFEIGCDLSIIIDVNNEIVQSTTEEKKTVKILALMNEGYATVDFTIPIEPVSLRCLLDISEISLLKKTKVFKINNNSFLKLDYVIKDCIIRDKGLDLTTLIEVNDKNNNSKYNDEESTINDDDNLVFNVDSDDTISTDSDENLIIDCLDTYKDNYLTSSNTKAKVIKYMYNLNSSSYFSFKMM